MLDDVLRDALEDAANDEVAAEARRQFGDCLTTALREGGQALWVGGTMFGSDRVEGESPFDFGSDATVGLATVLQIAGELVGGAIILFDQGNRYAAAALIRQLVEVEYLAWAFAEDDAEAKSWMRSSKEERQRFWKPVHIRKRAGDRFRGVDYGEHCGKGGHPSPEGIHLLPDHNSPEASAPFWWCDMAIHGHSVWCYALAAAEKLGDDGALTEIDARSRLTETEERWRESDPFLALIKRLTPRRGGLAEIRVEEKSPTPKPGDQ